jgi:hypothetical protein
MLDYGHTPVRSRQAELGDQICSVAEADVEPPNTSATAKAAWLLIFLAAIIQAYHGLSSILLPFLGDSSRGIGMVGWVATGALQLVIAVLALMQAARQNLRGATLAVAVAILLGWLTMVPPAIQHGLDFRADRRLTSGYFVLLPVIASAALAWRGSYLVLAALIVTAPTFVGFLFVIVFAISVALYGF